MQTILITDTQKPLAFNLIKMFVQRGVHVIAAPSDESAERPRKNAYDVFKKKPVTIVPWNRTSPLSSKNLILQSVQKYSPLEGALILIQPLPPVSSFPDLKYLDVESVLDVWIKGSILLARDLFSYFSGNHAGSLSFVILSLPKASGPSLLDDVCREAVLVLWKGLLKSAREAGISINAFVSRTTDEHSYAEFITSTFLEKCNKPGGKLFSF